MKQNLSIAIWYTLEINHGIDCTWLPTNLNKLWSLGTCRNRLGKFLSHRREPAVELPLVWSVLSIFVKKLQVINGTLRVFYLIGGE